MFMVGGGIWQRSVKYMHVQKIIGYNVNLKLKYLYQYRHPVFVSKNLIESQIVCDFSILINNIIPCAIFWMAYFMNSSSLILYL